MSVNLQFIPPTLHLWFFKGIFCDQLPEEICTGMVQNWGYGDQSKASSILAFQLAWFHLQDSYSLQTIEPTGMAEIELHHLSMQSNSHISEYLVWFNMLASQVLWEDVALCFQFYNGLPEWLKDKIMILGKPESLWEMVNVTVHYNTLYWEWQAEWKMNHCFDPKTTLSCPSEPPHTLTTILPSTNCNSTTTHCQPKGSWTTLHTLKPYNDVLGLDGKLKPEELECQHKNKLCLVCSSSNHQASKCPTSKWGHAMELQVGEELENAPKEETVGNRIWEIRKLRGDFLSMALLRSCPNKDSVALVIQLNSTSLSLNSFLLSLTSATISKHACPFIALLDSGSSHCFVDEVFAKKINLHSPNFCLLFHYDCLMDQLRTL